MITLSNLSKNYQQQEVIQPTSLTFKEGHIYGLVGRNGSGKTVLLKMLSGLLFPSSGEVVIDGKQLYREISVPESIGLIIEKPGFFEWKTGLQNLQILASLKHRIGKSELLAALESVGLLYAKDKKVKTYSLGMKQRLSIAQALMEDPKLLILDEPMNGLDKQGVELVRGLLLKEKEKGKLIILASHYREDIDVLCDEVYHIESGVITRE